MKFDFNLAIIALLFGTIASVTQAFAQQALTLSEAQRISEQNNSKIRLLKSDIEIAGQNANKAIAPQLPQITAAARHLLDNKFKFQEISLGGSPVGFSLKEPYTNFALGASLLIFDGLSTWNGYQSAKLAHSASELTFKRAQFQLQQDVRIKFHQALGAEKLLEVANQNVKALEAHVRDVRNLIKGGVATRFDLLKAEVQLADAGTDYLAAEDDLVLTRSKLAQAMGVDKVSISLAGILPDPSTISLEKLDISSSGVRDDREAQILLEQSANRASRAALGSWFPKVSLFAQEDWYSFENRGFGSDSKLRDSYTLGVLMSWSLFDGGSSIATRRIVAEQHKKSQEELRALNQAIPTDIDFWKRKLVHTIAVYRAGIAGVERSEESVRLAKNAAQAGTRTSTEVLDAERDLYVSRAKIVRAQVEAIEAIANLELALGKSLPLLR